MKYFLIVFITTFFLSCQNDLNNNDNDYAQVNSLLQKINTNDIHSHRSYQDSIMKIDSSLQVKFSNLKQLISDYRSLENEGNNTKSDNYFYYLSRLYGKVSNFYLKGFWIDTLKNEFINKKDYINFYDSAYFFAEKSLEINKDNIRAMHNLCYTFYHEYVNYNYDTTIVPILYKRDIAQSRKLSNYIVNNAKRFEDIDTSLNKEMLQRIYEEAISIFHSHFSNDNKFDKENTNQINILSQYADLWEFVRNRKYLLYRFDKNTIEKSYYANALMARAEIKNREFRERQEFEQQAESSTTKDEPLIFGKLYTFYDGRNSVLRCEECDPIWDITFTDKNNAVLISRMPNKSGQNGSCRSDVKYQYNPSTKTVTIISVSNNNVSVDCKNKFIGDWEWKKGKAFDKRFYSKSMPDCDFS
jgi:hypothetical protein